MTAAIIFCRGVNYVFFTILDCVCDFDRLVTGRQAVVIEWILLALSSLPILFVIYSIIARSVESEQRSKLPVIESIGSSAPYYTPNDSGTPWVWKNGEYQREVKR